jgi:hypothetical protein
MEDFKTMETPALMDLLAKQTTEYARMLADGTVGNNFAGCQATIILLQSELICRMALVH